MLHDAHLIDGAPVATRTFSQDSAQPFAAPELLGAVIGALSDDCAGVVPVTPLKIRDSVVRVDGGRLVEAVARAGLSRSFTPQLYRREVLAAALVGATEAKSCWEPLVRAGHAVADAGGDIVV